MYRKTLFAMALVVVFAMSIHANAQHNPAHFRGVINDFTAFHDAKGNTTGPWEMHGVWRLDLRDESGSATFSAALTMENSDYWLQNNVNPPADPDSPASRSPHTHHITMTDAQVTWDPSIVAASCPSASYNPPTTTGFMITGWASVTGNGGPAPFAPQGQLSKLTVCITGGSKVEFSNITLVFGAPASGHFGNQPVNGAVTVRH